MAAHQHALLWDVVEQTHGQILVPAHVDGEITRTAKKTSRKALGNYTWMKTQQQVQVLPAVGITGPGARISAFAVARHSRLPNLYSTDLPGHL